ncbi:MAG: metabolite traffic protein EboE [Granulosicoccus sp.]
MRLTSKTARTAHLSYCTNIHAGEQWKDLFPLLQQHVPEVKQQVNPDTAFGLGLRASMASISALRKPELLAEFKQWLKEQDIYVFTVNGFPYGAFHGTQVKADVYRPDWSTQYRLDYTCAIIDVLAQLGPPDDFGSISTVPGTFREWVNPDTRSAIIHNLLSCVAHCMDVHCNTGITIAIALEPEPACMLETVDDVLSFFEEELYSPASIELLAKLANSNTAAARTAMHTHIGVCYDICHAAVEFEDPLAAIQKMRSAGVPIVKLQLSSALQLPVVNPLTLAALQNFDEPVYLHQVVERQNDRLARFHDLPVAIQADELSVPQSNGQKEWRVHFHVPVFLSSLEHFGTTQQDLTRVLQAHARSPIAPHLEVETYTWDVLPESYRNVSVDQAIARELDWVLDSLKLDSSITEVA